MRGGEEERDEGEGIKKYESQRKGWKDNWGGTKEMKDYVRAEGREEGSREERGERG